MCYFPDSGDNLIVAIGSSSQVTLKFDEIVSSLLSEEMRQKTMDNHSMDALSMKGLPQERNKNKGSGGRSKSKGRSKSPGKGIRKCWKCGKAGHYKKIADQIMLRKKRDMRIPFPQRQRTPQKKEGMCT